MEDSEEVEQTYHLELTFNEAEALIEAIEYMIEMFNPDSPDALSLVAKVQNLKLQIYGTNTRITTHED